MKTKLFSHKSAVLALIFYTLWASTVSASPQTRINPDADLVYLGAFRVPLDKSNNTSWDFGGGGMTYNPDGDPTGANDGFPGTLFGIGKMANGNVSEITIPAPVISNKISDLPLSQPVQNLQEITGGRIGGTATTYRIGDIQIIPKRGNMADSKLFWCIYEFYTPEFDLLGFGWSSLQLSSPNPEGLWRVGNDVTAATTRYIFSIPEDWAAKYTGGKSLAVGRDRSQMNGSFGPALFAIAPWSETLSNGSLMEAKTLLRYSIDNPLPNGYSHDDDDWNDGAWLTIGGKSAVMLAGAKGFRTLQNGLIYYGEPGPDGCGSKGWHAEPDYAAIIFYDPDDLAKVAQGLAQPFEIRPYAIWNAEKYMYQGFECRKKMMFGGVGYDKTHQLLYIEEKNAGNGISSFDQSPVIHVWRLIDGQNQVLDATPPTLPSSIVVEDISPTEKKIRWTAANDNSGTVYYIVYRNGKPIIMTNATEHIDTKFTLITDATTFSYTVEARDPLNNSSLSLPIPSIKSIGIK